MVSLEALRESLIKLEYDTNDLIDCHETFTHNYGHILDNLWDGHQPWHEEFFIQKKRLDRIQKQCRYSQHVLDQDRDFLELFCQQFAFAADMVGPCADILTCRDKELDYRWDGFSDY